MKRFARAGRAAWLAAGAALGLALLAGGWLLARHAAPPPPAPAPPAAALPAPPEPVAVPEAPPAPAAEPAATAEIPLTALPLRLLATTVEPDPRRSLAAVEDLEAASYQVMSEGDAFRHRVQARLVHIDVDHVLLDNAGRLEKLPLDPAIASALEGGRPPGYELSGQAREQRRRLAERVRDLQERGSRGVVFRGGLLAEGDALPVYEEGELVGIQLEAVRPGGFYDQLGLRDGDLVRSVNGVPFGGPGAPAELLAELATSPTLELDVQRGDGSEASIPVSTQRVIQGLKDLE
jgi:general secretion pathway protein C